MIGKVWKAVKEVAIAVLLVLSLWLVVNAALKKSEGHFEFGNLMDLFNTLGTVGTLVVAYKAYKAAPRWIHQKMDENALQLANTLLAVDIPNVNKKIKALHLVIKDLDELTELVGIDYSIDQFKENFDEKSKVVQDIFDCLDVLDQKLTSIIRYGWIPKKKFSELHAIYLSEVQSHISNIRSIKLQVEILTLSKTKPENEKFQTLTNSLLKRCKIVMDSQTTYTKSYNNLISLYNRAPDYFDKE